MLQHKNLTSPYYQKKTIKILHFSRKIKLCGQLYAYFFEIYFYYNYMILGTSLLNATKAVSF